MALVFAVAVELLRQASAGEFVENADPIGFQAGILALPERRRRTERQDVGQKIGNLIQQIDPMFRILDPDMDMHAADQQPLRQRLHVLGQNIVSILIGMTL